MNSSSLIFFFNGTAPSEIYTLSLHDALPICQRTLQHITSFECAGTRIRRSRELAQRGWQDRKSTRLNSSHPSISYAVFCLKKKKITGGISPVSIDIFPPTAAHTTYCSDYAPP